MLEPIDVPPRDQASVAPAVPGEGGLLAGGAALAASSTVSNAIGALITIALARTFSGAQFGGLAALLSIALVATVPATGLQYVIARRTSEAALARSAHDRTGLRYSVLLGVALAVVLAAGSSVLSAFLGVPALAIVVVGLTIIPYMINAAQLGALLGASSYSRFAMAQFVLAATRLSAVVLACASHASMTGVMLCLLMATWLTVLCCVRLTGLRTWTATLPATTDFAREIAQATLALAGMSVVMNLDILLARHYLSGDDSGTYALGALFAKAALWIAQFVPQLIFPRLARSFGQRPLLIRGIAADIAVGGAVLAIAVSGARPMLDVVSGHANPAAAARLAPLFAVLGTAWALCYLLVLSSVAARNQVPARILWVVVAAEAVAVALRWHHGAEEIVVTCIVGTVVLVVAAAASALRANAATSSVKSAAA